MPLITVNVRGATADDLAEITRRLTHLRDTQLAQGELLMGIREDVQGLIGRAQVDYDEVVRQRDQANADLVVALGNDAADAATIAAKQTEIDAQKQETSEASALTSFDLDASFPAEQPLAATPGEG